MLLPDDRHRFCLNESPQSHARIRIELETITEILLDTVPRASVVLSGSLAYGEGQLGQDGLRMASDYDLFVIVPRFSDITKILTTRNPSVQKLISLEILTNLEIIVIWRPFILRGLTHVNGIMLAGDQVISRALEQSRLPHGDRMLCRAYKAFLRASHNDVDQRFLQKAMTFGFRAWLLNRSTEGGESWRYQDIYSFRGNLTGLYRHTGTLPEPWRELIEWALLAGLGISSSPRERVHLKTVLAFLTWVHKTIRISHFCWGGFLYAVFQVRRSRSFTWPHRFVPTYLALAGSLAEVCAADGTLPIPIGIIRGIERLAGTAYPRKASLSQTDWAISEMITLADANPHKIVIRRHQQSVRNLTHHL